MRVDNLETWAGPGQAWALVGGQRQLRADLAKMQLTQHQHTRMLTSLASDVSELKTWVSGLETRVSGLETRVSGLETRVSGLESTLAGVADMVREILRRLPAPPAQA